LTGSFSKRSLTAEVLESIDIEHCGLGYCATEASAKSVYFRTLTRVQFKSRLRGFLLQWMPSLCVTKQKQHVSNCRSFSGTCHLPNLRWGQRFPKQLWHML
jgi:hypothetical protein